MGELKACHCGSKPKLWATPTGDFIRCDNCGLTISYLSGFDDDKLVSEWNRRAAPENKPLTLEQLRQMNGEPVYSPQCEWGIVGFRKVGTDEHGGYDKKYTVGFSYGWEWLDDVLRIGPLYAHKPEQEEK